MIPPRNIVLRDFKRGSVKVVHKDRGSEITRFVTLSNAMIPDKHMAETNPNHPLEKDLINAWDTERLQWVRFNLSDVTEYKPFPGYGWQEDTVSGNEKATETRSSKKGSRDRSTQGVQTSEETQTDDRGAEGQGEGESGEGKGGKRSSKE